MQQAKIRVVVNFTEGQLNGIDHLVTQGVYMNRQTVIRSAVRALLKDHEIYPFYGEAEG